MMNMKLLEVVTSPYIYHGCSNWKTLWEEKFTCEEKLTLGEFTALKMKILVFTILGNTKRSRLVISTSPLTSL